jgi:hypothetical protein
VVKMKKLSWIRIAVISITAQYVGTHPKVAHNIKFILIPPPKRESLSTNGTLIAAIYPTT